MECIRSIEPAGVQTEPEVEHPPTDLSVLTLMHRFRFMAKYLTLHHNYGKVSRVFIFKNGKHILDAVSTQAVVLVSELIYFERWYLRPQGVQESGCSSYYDR